MQIVEGRETVYSVIDFRQVLSLGVDPDHQVIHRSADPLISFKIELGSSRVWWNTKDKLFQDKKEILALPNIKDFKISWFNVTAEYLFIRLVRKAKKDVRDKTAFALTVYHRKSLACVLNFPAETSCSEMGTVHLRDQLELLFLMDSRWICSSGC